MAGEKLSALAVERAHRLKKPAMLNDGQGLYFRKQTASGASWLFRYKFAGKPRWFTLGNFPDMSLAEARKQARAQRVNLDKDRDPHAIRQETLEKEAKRGSFKELADEWLAKETSKLKHPAVPRRVVYKHLMPSLRNRRADEIRAADVTRILDGIRDSTPAMANDVLRFAKRIFAFGRRRHVIPINPVADLSPLKDGGGVERGRKRALSEQELIALFKALRETPSFGLLNLLTVKLLLALLVRKVELLGAPWKEFDLEGGKDGPVWHLSSKRVKTAQDLDIPLVPPVVDWLKTLKLLSGNSEYVFAPRRRSRRARFQHVGTDTINFALSQVKHGLEHFTVHDFRRTGRTHLAALGVRREVAERCLNHVVKGVEGIYDQHAYFSERRAALEQWTNLLVELEASRGSTTAIHTKRRRSK